MESLSKMLSPMSLAEFASCYLGRQPLARPSMAAHLQGLFDWPMASEILKSHRDCWLPKNGELPEAQELNTGQLSLAQVQAAFASGRTLLLRHSEAAHPALAKLATEFKRHFKGPIDIQLYATPGGSEGFDWHYDSEEVFVIQTVGEKEFRLRKNRYRKPPPHKHLPKNLDLKEWTEGPELRCQLYAGDWLYIPSGYWHKARAHSDSFHLSVGVMDPQFQSKDAAL